jgi:hypothetical protein
MVTGMSDKATPAGWVVQVTTPGEPSLNRSASGRLSAILGAPAFEYFNVAIAAPVAAIEATTKQLTDRKDREARVVRSLSSEEIAVLRLKAGDVAAA